MPAIGAARGPTVTAISDDAWSTPPGRAQIMPVRYVSDGGHPHVVRATGRGSGSHLVARLALAEGLAVIPATTESVAVGDRIRVMRVKQ